MQIKVLPKKIWNNAPKFWETFPKKSQNSRSFNFLTLCFSQNFPSLPICGKIFRLSEECCFSPETALLRVDTLHWIISSNWKLVWGVIRHNKIDNILLCNFLGKQCRLIQFLDAGMVSPSIGTFFYDCIETTDKVRETSSGWIEFVIWNLFTHVTRRSLELVIKCTYMRSN